jgi:hypothetical protein
MESHPNPHGGASSAHTIVALQNHDLPPLRQCVDGRSTLALWELDQSNEPYDARLVIKHAALSIVTEILTTLTLIRMAEHLSW